MRPLSRAVVVTAATLALDLASMVWARANLSPAEIGTSPGPLRLSLVENRGASFGLGAGHPGLVAATAAAGLVVLGVWLVRAQDRLSRYGLAAALGGGLGNLVDRAAHGAVTDWINLTGYPATFNVADVAIRAGLLAALIGLIRTPRALPRARRTKRSGVLEVGRPPRELHQPAETVLAQRLGEVGGQPVEDDAALLARADQTGGAQQPQGVGDLVLVQVQRDRQIADT